MGMTVDTSEVRALCSRLATAGPRIGARGSLVFRKTGFDIVADAKVFSAVDTGDQQESIGVDFSGDGRSGSMSLEAGPTTDYSIWQELGTSVMAAHPFMGPAFDRRLPPFLAALGQMAAEETV